MKWVKYIHLILFVAGLSRCVWLLYVREYLQVAVTLGILAVLAAVYAFAWYPSIKVDDLMHRLQKHGVSQRGKIMAVRSTSQYLNELPILKVQVQYVDSNNNEITSEVSQPIPFQSLANITPFKNIGILVDSKNPKVFVLDL